MGIRRIGGTAPQSRAALNTLSEDYITLGQAERAIPYTRRLITLDPLNEASHRKLMESIYKPDSIARH